MSQTTDQLDQDYKPGCWAWLGMVSFGGCGTLISIPIGLLAAGFICVLDLCWMSNNVGWTTVIWGVVGFLMAMGVAYSGMESSYRKKKDEEQKKLDEERRRRLEEAQLRWLEEQEQGGQGPPPPPPPP